MRETRDRSSRALISAGTATTIALSPGAIWIRRGTRSCLEHAEGVIFLVNPVAKNLDANDDVYALAA
jgi:hypothetical protein